MFPVPSEAIFNQHDAVARTALVGVNGEPVIIVELKETMTSFQKKELETELMELAKTKPLTSVIQKVLYHSSFPVDVRHNAKIHRPDLAVWAKSQLG
jgi:predicted transcriptional regulator